MVMPRGMETMLSENIRSRLRYACEGAVGRVRGSVRQDLIDWKARS